jgi:hypothetical protein
MSSPSKPSNKPVTIEDLLRLKRAERPAAEFWSQFDDALRAKQLAAIVERRPWWRIDLGGLAGGLSRLRVPVGIAAVGVLSFVTVQQFRAPTVVTSETTVNEADVAGVSNVTFSGGAAVAATTAETTALTLAPDSVVADQVAGTSLASASTPAESEASRYAGLLESVPGVAVANETGSLGSSGFSSDFRALRATGLTGLDSTGVATLDFGTLRGSNRAEPVEEPLARVTSPTESRRERLAALVAPASMKSSSRTPSPDRVRDRMISRLSEDELYSSVSRLGVERGGLRVSF